MATSLSTLVQDHGEELERLQQRLDYRFRDIHLLQQALVHSSFAFERLRPGRDNEILEFLGDAVLDLAVGYLLHQRFPELREGQLTRLRAGLVNEASLAAMAREIDLGDCLHLGRGEEATRGRSKSSILSCAYEAVLGAVFLDGGFPVALELVRHHFALHLARDPARLALDAKSGLQEVLQERFSEGPVYTLENEEGPPHARLFTVSVRFRDEILGRGSAGSKKAAEQQAASEALRALDEHGPQEG
ncbi:MAG: ribonuclease III [Desulfobulbaceae bacterium A2]|nr:MAG: ribonuclease III [Desulfobulbaceae bacterium A2]